MARLRSKSTYPPRGYNYIQAETRLKIEGENYKALMKKVLDHRIYKGLPRATMDEVVEDVERQICSRLTTRECKPEGIEGELRPVNESQVLSAKTVLVFSKAAFDWLRSGAQIVDIEQMRKRQNTCLSCPLNQPLKACACTPFYKMINALVPAERRNDQLHVCVACGCSIAAKTQMPIKMVLKADEGRNIQYAPGCWVTEESLKT